MKKRSKEQISQLMLKDRITLNDLRIKVGKVIEHASKNNVNIVSVSVRSTPDNVDNAKGVLMNVKSVAVDKLKPISKIEEYSVNDKDEEILISGANSPTIDMSAEQLREYLQEENCKGLYLRQVFEMLKKTQSVHEGEEATQIKEDIEKRFRDIRSTIDDMFRANQVTKEKTVQKKKLDVMVHAGMGKKWSDVQHMSIDDVAKINLADSTEARYITTELEDKLHSMDGVRLLDKLRHYKEKNSERAQGSGRNRLASDNQHQIRLVKNYKDDKLTVDPGIAKLKRLLKDDPETFEAAVSYFTANNLEFSDRNIVKFLEHRHHERDAHSHD